MVTSSLQGLKTLEALVARASEALRRVGEDNRALRERLRRADDEHKLLKEELRQARAALARHERVKSRLLKLSEKLERIA